MAERHASINDRPIGQVERLFRWPQRPRPLEHLGLSELGLEPLHHLKVSQPVGCDSSSAPERSNDLQAS